MYTREQLIEIGNQVFSPGKKVCVSLDLHSKVKGFNLSTVSTTKRGTRSGSGKQKQNLPYSVKFGLLNVRSIVNSTELFVDTVENYNLDLVALTETWLRPNDDVILGEMCPPGYDVIHIPRRTGRGGGVAFVFKQCFKTLLHQNKDYNSMENMEFTLNCNSETYRIIVIYRPPSSSKNGATFGVFLEEFNSLLESCMLTNGTLVILGDFNIHMDDANSAGVSKFHDLLQEYGLYQHVSGPTHNHGHTLDLVITRHQSDINGITCQDPLISDHELVSFFIKSNKSEPKLPPTKTTYRRYKSLNEENFCADILSSELDRLNSTDPVTLLGSYEKILTDLLNKHVPLCTKTVSQHPKVPWFNNDIKMAKMARRKAERKWCQSRTSTDRDLYVQAKDRVVTLIRKHKKRHFCDKIMECKGDQKLLFQTANLLLNRKKSTKLPDSDIDKLPEIFSNYFIGKIQKIQEGLLKNCSDDDPHCFDRSAKSKLLTFEPVTIDEIKTLVKKSPSKQCSSDPIPTWLLKNCLDVLAPTLCNIINASLLTGIVPSAMKNALVTPLLKKPSLDPNNLKNYRPVSNLSFISKLLEKSVASRLNQYKDEFDLREINQSAYRKGHSCETAILKIMSDILLACDKNQCTLLVMLDLSATFDTVDHSILLKRLQTQQGFDGNILNWIQSYLHQRTQSVVVNGKISQRKTKDCDVPQGSVLGPDFYSDFTQPLGDLIRHYGIVPSFYADDSQKYIHFNPNSNVDVMSAVSKMELCCAKVKDWMSSNQLKLNEDKTEVMIFGKPSDLKKLNITSICIGDSKIRPSLTATNIGVDLDSELNLNKQINKMVSSGWYHLSNISRVRKYLTKETTETLVHAFVMSKLDTYNSTLAGIPNFQIYKLQKIQNAAARLIVQAPKSESATKIRKELHWLPVYHRIRYKLLLLTYKSLNGQGPK